MVYKERKAVKIPDRVVIVNSKYKYVYLTQGVTYSSEKKRSIPNRVLIGPHLRLLKKIIY